MSSLHLPHSKPHPHLTLILFLLVVPFLPLFVGTSETKNPSKQAPAAAQNKTFMEKTWTRLQDFFAQKASSDGSASAKASSSKSSSSSGSASSRRKSSASSSQDESTAKSSTGSG